MTYCHVSRQIDDYLSDEEEREARCEAIDAIVNDLMAPNAEYDPINPGNLSESFADDGDGFYGLMAALIRANDGAKLLALIESHARGYWGGIAAQEAEKQLEKQINEYHGD